MSLLRPGVIKQHKPNQTIFSTELRLSDIYEEVMILGMFCNPLISMRKATLSGKIQSAICDAIWQKWIVLFSLRAQVE